MARTAIFVEDRVVRDNSGRILTTNRRLGSLEWRALGPQGHTAILSARLGDGEGAEQDHLVDGEVAALPYFRGIRESIVKLPALVARSIAIARNADLVVVKCPGLIGTVGAFAAKVTGTPLAIHFVGDIEDSVSESRDPNAGRFVKWIAKTISRWAVRQGDAVRYPTRSFLQQKYPAIAPNRQYWYTDASVEAVDVVPDPPRFVPGRILAIGTQERMYKGHDFLIRALPKIREVRPDATLVLVGKGACRPELEALAKEMGVEEVVQFVDFLDGWGSVSEMISSANVFAMPSMAEGLPRALLEAMSLGAACVGSDASGIPELLPAHLLVPRGTVAPLAGLLVRLLSDDQFRLAAAKECLERARPFSAAALRPNILRWDERLQELIAA